MNLTRLFRRPRLLVCLLFLSSWLGCASAPKEESGDLLPNILLVSFDTLRADHLGVYGFPGEITPNLDALGSRGTVFESVITQAPWTRPGHFALLAGRYPDRRMLRYDLKNCVITPAVVTLAELLSSAGYLTAAFTGGGYLAATTGFAQGFDVFESHGRRFEENLESVLRWLDRHGESRFFLFLHNYNSHRPYTPPAEVLSKFVREVPDVCLGVSFSNEDAKAGLIRKCLDHADGADYLRGLYAAEAFQVDRLFGKVLEKLRKTGNLENILIVVTADHGEELLDHGSLDHVKTLYQELVKAPLIFAGWKVPAGVRIQTEVEILDVMPTILELLDLDIPPGVDGKSLVPLFTGEPFTEAPVFTATSYDTSLSGFWLHPHAVQGAVVQDGWKLYYKESQKEEKFELYNLQEDPEERVDLTGSLGNKAVGLKDTLLSWLENLPEDTYCENEAMDAATRKQLEALGYLE